MIAPNSSDGSKGLVLASFIDDDLADQVYDSMRAYMFQQIRPEQQDMPRPPESEQERRELYRTVKAQLTNVQQAAMHLENSAIAETQHAAEERAAQNDPDIGDCPICCEDINPEDATMRCDGRGSKKLS